MSCSPSASEMGNYSDLDVEKAIEAIEESFKNLQCLDRVNLNSVKNLYDEYDKLSQSYNEEFEKLTYNAIEEVKKISEDKNAEESIRKLAEDGKKQEENLERRIFEMRKELDVAESKLVEQHKQAVNVLKLIKESQEIKALEKIKDLDEDCIYLKEMNETLELKQGKRNEELHEARKSLLENAFADIPDSTEDRAAWKMIGELNFTPFMDAMEEKYNCEEQEAYLLAVPVYDVWEGYLRDPQWHPLKVVNVDGQPKEIIDVDDQKLKNLKNDYGEEVYNAVTTALTLRMQYNPIQRRAVEDLWNYRQNRRATIGEGVAQLVKIWDDKPRLRLP